MYTLREVSETDILTVVKIYNSNVNFLKNHLGCLDVNENFIKQEIEQMKLSNFVSSAIIESGNDKVVGVIDYRVQEKEVYLSLIMIDSSLQGYRLGRKLYSYFENLMRDKKQKFIRIDVVNDYENNLVLFWESLGFVCSKEIELEWANKKSRAVVMRKVL